MVNGITSSTYKGDRGYSGSGRAKNHPVTAGLPENFVLHDELYSNMHMLTLDAAAKERRSDGWRGIRTEKNRACGNHRRHGCYDDPNFQN